MKTVYRANDGTVWENIHDCITHDEEIIKKEEEINEKEKKEKLNEIDEIFKITIH